MIEKFKTFDLAEEDYGNGGELIARKEFPADYLDFFEEVIEVARQKTENIFAMSNGIRVFVSKNSNVASQHLARIYFKKAQKQEANDKIADYIFFGKLPTNL
jgi:hypothetical protein